MGREKRSGKKGEREGGRRRRNKMIGKERIG